MDKAVCGGSSYAKNFCDFLDGVCPLPGEGIIRTAMVNTHSTRISPDEWFSLYASGSHVLSDHHFYTTETAYARPFGVSMETLFKIAEVLDVPVSKLFEV